MNRHSEVLAEESLLNGAKLLRHYGTKSNRHCEGGTATLHATNIRNYLSRHCEEWNDEAISLKLQASVQRNVAIASNRDLREQNTECAVRRSNDAVGAMLIHSNVRFSFFGSFSFFLYHNKKKEMNNKKRDCFATLAMTRKKSFAFTLSEILIVLAVLGVVAAMTIPDLIQDYQKKATVTALKKAYSKLNQVVTSSAADNGPMSDFFAAHPSIDADTAKEYYDTYWLSYFRVQKVGVNNGRSFYNSVTPYYTPSGTHLETTIATIYSLKRILFSDVSGTIYFMFLDSTSSHAAQYIYVDINGAKGPNTFGKDVFAFYGYLDSNSIEPMGYYYPYAIDRHCSSNGYTCAAKIKRDGWEIADDYPW